MTRPNASAYEPADQTFDRTSVLVDRCMQAFEEAWQAGHRPDLRDHLPAGGPDRLTVLVELVHIDLERRLKAGEAVRLEEYLERFPELVENTEATRSLIAAEFALRQHLSSLCNAEEYQQRFPAHAEALALTPTPAPEASNDTHLLVSPTGGPAASVGSGLRYQVLRFHARGNLGEIHVAQDTELGREVALKRIQPQHLAGRAAADMQTRFVREAEITGRLEHPGVVPVYGLVHDAAGQPCYAMRLVEGQTLQEAIQRFHQPEQQPDRDPGARRLAFRELLGRFVAVCQTLAYAHSRGIVHRDLKPSNVLLGKYGETLVVDWGLAKKIERAAPERCSAEQSLTPNLPASQAAQTQPGGLAGTPAYMSPEQAAGRVELLGPASDIYSLGATLYCLLTGQAPFSGGDVPALLWAVQQGEYRPPDAVKPAVPPALAAVCRKAMAREPSRRYASASALAEDVEHWLADEPVSAWPEPWTIKSRRWINRHRTFVAGAAAAVLAVAMSLGVATYFLSRANHDLDIANQNERLAKDEALAQKERVTESYRLAREGLEAAVAIKDDERLKSGKLEDLKKKLAQAEAGFYEKFVRLHGDEEAFRFERAMAYSKLGVATVLLGNREDAIHHFETSAKILEQLKEEFPDNLRYQDELQQHYNDIGYFFQGLNRLEKAESALRKAHDIQLALAQRWPQRSLLAWHRAMTLTNLGAIYRDTHRVAEAENFLKEALGLMETATRNCPKTGTGSNYWSALANIHTHLGYLYSLTGRPRRVIPERTQGIAIWKEVVNANPNDMKLQRNLAMGYHFLGMTYQFRYEWALAEENFLAAMALRKKLAEEHPALAELKSELTEAYYQLAWVYQNTGRQAKALAEYPAMIAVFEDLSAEYPNYPAYSSKLSWAYNDMGVLAAERKKYPEAEQAYLKSLRIRRALVKRYPANAQYQSDLTATLNNLGNVYLKAKRLDEAEGVYEEAVRLGEQLHRNNPVLADYTFELAGHLTNLGLLHFEQDRFQDALDQYNHALKLGLELVAKDPANLAYRAHIVKTYKESARACDALGRHEDAITAQGKAIACREKMTKEQPGRTEWKIELGKLYEGMARYVSHRRSPAESLTWYARAKTQLTPLARTPGHQKEVNRALGEVWAGMGLVQSKQLGHHSEAIRSYDEALKLYPEKENTWIHLYRACAVARQGDHRRASKTAERIVKQASITSVDLKDAAYVLALCAASAMSDSKLADAERAKAADQYGARAVQLLIRAKEAGYFKAVLKDDRRLADKDLDVLRKRPDFREFVKRLGVAKDHRGQPSQPIR